MEKVTLWRNSKVWSTMLRLYPGIYESARTAFKHPINSMDIQVVESIEDISPIPSMLSPQDFERVDVKVISPDGSYFKLSAILNMTSDRIKMTLRLGLEFNNCGNGMVQVSACNSVILRQCNGLTQLIPDNLWMVDGYKWSSTFSVSSEGMMRISVKKFPELAKCS
ncbi:hypothetical protein ACFE04_021010 [Oxalis oulophora]